MQTVTAMDQATWKPKLQMITEKYVNNDARQNKHFEMKYKADYK